MYSVADLATEDFKEASGEAALLELRLRLCAGTIPVVSDLPIATIVSVLKDAIFEHFKAVLTPADIELISRACTLRNKLLHCDFSSARKKLNEGTPKTRSGGVSSLNIEGLSARQALEKILQMSDGMQVGQAAVGDTKTKTLKDILGWVLECHNVGEFREATMVFRDAILILDRVMTA